MCSPTSFDPVKAIIRTRGCSTKGSPTSVPDPVMMFSTPGGSDDLAPPQPVRGAQQDGRAVLCGDAAPGWKRAVGGFDGPLHLARGGLVQDRNDLVHVGGVTRVELVVCGEPLAADDQRELLPHLPAHLRQGALHRGAVGLEGEVGKRLVTELRQRHPAPPRWIPPPL